METGSDIFETTTYHEPDPELRHRTISAGEARVAVFTRTYETTIEDLWDACTDPERLGQVVGNLVENALKYATSSVTVDTVAMNGHLEVRVDDDGPGIAPEERLRVFDRLYTARDTPGRQVGTGIGLAIVHELAGAMGGTTSCELLAAGGTRFRVTLPV